MKTTVPLKLLLTVIGFALFSIKAQSQTARGDALSLQGDASDGNSYVQTSDNDKSLKSYTIETWVNWTVANPYAINFLCGKDTEQMEIHFGGSGHNNIRFIPTPGVYVDAANAMPTNQWVHLAVVYNYEEAVAKIYVDGEERASRTVVTQEMHTTNNFAIGARGNGDYPLKGMVDEFRVWKTARTPQEIRENMYLAILPAYSPDLVQYFQFNGLAIDNVSGNVGAMMGGATLVESTASVSTGASFTRNNMDAGTPYDFTGTGLNLTFHTPPNDDFVVTRLDGKPAGTQVISANNTFENYYWIVRDYGSYVANRNITAKFDVGSGQLIADDTSSPALLKLQQRIINAIGNAWAPTNAASLANPAANEVTFSNVGTLQELVLTRDPDRKHRGNAAVFNGVNTAVTIPDIDNGLSSYTMEGWVYWSPNTPNDIEFLFGKTTSQMEVHFGGIGDNGIRFIPQSGIFVDAPNAMPINKWTHIAITFNAASAIAKLYVNGVEKGSATIYGVNANTADNFMIGVRGDGSFHLTGKVDEVRIWNYARTEQQIRENMHLIPSDESNGMTHYYQFNDDGRSGTTIDNIGGENGVINAALEPSGANVGIGDSYVLTNPEADTEYYSRFVNLGLTFGTAPNGDVVITRIKDKPAGTQIDDSNVTVLDNYYWVIDNYGTITNNLNIKARFGFDDGQFVSDAVAADIKLNQRNTNTLGAWSVTNTASAINVNDNEVSFTGVDNLTEIALSKLQPVLPVKLISFTAKANGNYALLQWKTASEVGSKGFEVWRKVEGEKVEGLEFVKIGDVQAKPSALQPSAFYTYTDKQPLNGNNYYKLVQIDNDGKENELGVRILNFGLPISDMRLFPNPTTINEVTLNWGNNPVTAIKLIDLNGKVLDEIRPKVSSTGIVISLLHYPAGTYLVRIESANGVEVRKIVKL